MSSGLIRDDPCPGCGSPLWFRWEPDTGCSRCSEARAARTVESLTPQGRLHRMRVSGKHGPAVLNRLSADQDGKCAACGEDAWLEIDYDPVGLEAIGGVCRGCRLIMSRLSRDPDLVKRRMLEFRRVGDSREGRYRDIWVYLRRAARAGQTALD